MRENSADDEMLTDIASGRRQWPNRDPIQELGGWNLYGFFRNEAIDAIDPFGDTPEWLHCTLDGLGALEPTPFCDMINGCLYLKEGDKGNAAVAAAGILPYLGDLGKVGKYGKRAFKKFTAKGKKEVIDANKARNSGRAKCENCGTDTVPPKKHEKGETPPGNDMTPFRGVIGQQKWRSGAIAHAREQGWVKLGKQCWHSTNHE